MIRPARPPRWPVYRIDMSISEHTLRIATRQSRLALWQAEHVAALLRNKHPEPEGRAGPHDHAG